MRDNSVLLACLLLISIPTVSISSAGSAVVWTDKLNYGYWETVKIYGSGFNLNANIVLTIIRPDSVVESLSTTSDASGRFVYDYVLDGIIGTYTVEAADGGHSATTTFTEGAITPELWGYTLQPHPDWTHGDVKGYYECQWVPYKIEIANTRPMSVQLKVIVHHDYFDGTFYGLDQDRNFLMWRDGVAETPTIAGPQPDGWSSGIQQLEFNWTFTIGEGDNCTLAFETHIAIGAHNYPGSKIHTSICDIITTPDTPVCVGHRDVPVVATGPLLCSVALYTDPVVGGSIGFQSETYVNGQSDTFSYDTSGLASATPPVGYVFGHWEVSGNVGVSSTAANPTTVTITCGGTLKAVFAQILYTVTFYTDPSNIGSVTFGDTTYTSGQSGQYGAGSYSVVANAPSGWSFDHWITTGGVTISPSASVTGDGTVTAVFVPIMCSVTFYTDPGGSISFKSKIYTNGQFDTFSCGTSDQAVANPPLGYVFDCWVATGNVQVESPTTSPTTVTITNSGTLKAVFKCAPSPAPVGGEWVPIDKSALLTPWISWVLIMTLVTVPFVYAGRKKRTS